MKMLYIIPIITLLCLTNLCTNQPPELVPCGDYESVACSDFPAAISLRQKQGRDNPTSRECENITLRSEDLQPAASKLSKSTGVTPILTFSHPLFWLEEPIGNNVVSDQSIKPCQPKTK